MPAVPWLKRRVAIALAVGLASLLFIGGTHSAWAFTQSGFSIGFANGIPMGHEWVTRMAGIELMGYSPAVAPDVPDPNDPRKTWTQGLARNTNISSPGAQAELKRIKGETYNDQRYASRYKAVFDAIIGERWVDLAGYNAATSKECWDAVAQEPVEVQYDHFMRQYNDAEGGGGVHSAQQSQERFIKYFVTAAMAPSNQISVYDGGVQGSTAVSVSRNYFLLGRAVHLFEDSFSSEHTVRISLDNYVQVRQVKSYLCAAGSEQHTHSNAAVLNYSSGDVVWKQGTGLDPSWGGYKASNMKSTALVATEAMKDLWAAFIRTMGTPRDQREKVANDEAKTLASNWLGYDKGAMESWYNDEANRDSTYVLGKGQKGKGQTMEACMTGLNVGTNDQGKYVKQLEAAQRKCVYNAIPWVGYTDVYDTSMHMYFAWRWRNGPTGSLLDPPKDWKIPTNIPADSGVQVRVKSLSNGQYMSAPDGISNNAWVYCKPGPASLDFTMVGPKNDAVFRSASDPLLFLSYTGTTGSVKLYNPYTVPNLDPTNYKVDKAGHGWSLMSVYWKQYMWLSGESPYITGTGKPSNKDAQWEIDGLK
ncbi:MAG TPA: hypothetical protein VIG99_23255 [Myxococcaceae bacterium]|jgi:hypothetical protein